jgi:hypothetical protein
MFRQPMTRAALVIALLCVIGIPNQANAQRGRGGFRGSFARRFAAGVPFGVNGTVSSNSNQTFTRSMSPSSAIQPHDERHSNPGVHSRLWRVQSRLYHIAGYSRFRAVQLRFQHAADDSRLRRIYSRL